MTEPDDGPPRGVLIAAVVVAVLALAGVLVAAAFWHREEPRRPIAVVAVPAPQADDPACRALLSGLPDRLGEYERLPVAQPAPTGAAVWRRSDDQSDDIVTLRCGLERPLDFVTGTPVQMVDDVAWFRAAEGGLTTWTTVDRPVFVALTLPDGSGPTPIQLVSTSVAKSMPAVVVNPGPPR